MEIVHSLQHQDCWRKGTSASGEHEVFSLAKEDQLKRKGGDGLANTRERRGTDT